MKKIDILNFITNFRTQPNEIKTFGEIKNHLNAPSDELLLSMLNDMKQLRTLQEVEKNGERAYKVTAK